MSTQKTEETGYVVKVYANRDKWLNLLSELSAGGKNLNERVKERVQEFFNEYSAQLSPGLIDRYNNSPEDIVQLGKDALKEMGVVSLQENSIDRLQSEIRRNQRSGTQSSAEVLSDCQALLFEIMMPYMRQASELQNEIDKDNKTIGALEEKRKRIVASSYDSGQLLDMTVDRQRELKTKLEMKEEQLQVAREFTDSVVGKLGISKEALDDNSMLLRAGTDPERVLDATDLAINQYYANQSSMQNFERIQDYGVLYNQLRFQKMRPEDIKKQLQDPEFLALLDEKSKNDIKSAVEKGDVKEMRSAGVRALRLLGFDDKQDRAYLEQTKQQLDALKQELATAKNPDLVNDVEFRVLVENLERENEEFARVVKGENVRDKTEVPLSRLVELSDRALSTVEKTKPKKALDDTEVQTSKKDRLSRRKTEADLSRDRPLRSIANLGGSADNLPKAKKPALLERLRTFTQNKTVSQQSLATSTPPNSPLSSEAGSRASGETEDSKENVSPNRGSSVEDSASQSEISPRDLDSESVDSSLSVSPREEKGETPRAEGPEKMEQGMDAKSETQLGGVSEKGLGDAEEKTESVKFDVLYDEETISGLKEKVERTMSAVSAMDLRGGEPNTFKEQIKQELSQLAEELVAHWSTGTINQGLLEETEQKIELLEKRVRGLVQNEQSLVKSQNTDGKVDKNREADLKRSVIYGRKAVQNSIDDIRSINVDYQENRKQSTEINAQVVDSTLVADVQGVEAKQFSDVQAQQQTGRDKTVAGRVESSPANETDREAVVEDKKQTPLEKIRGIVANMMSSTAGLGLMKSIGDYFETRMEKRREAMSNSAPGEEKFPKKGLGDLQDLGPEPEDIDLGSSLDESEDFDQMAAKAEDLQAVGRPSEAGGDEEDLYESYLIGDEEEVAAWKEKAAQQGQKQDTLLSRESMASAESAEDQKDNRRLNQGRQSIAAVEDESEAHDKVALGAQHDEESMADELKEWIEEGVSEDDEMETVPLFDGDLGSRDERVDRTQSLGGSVERGDVKPSSSAGSVRGDEVKPVTEAGSGESFQSRVKGSATKEPGAVAGFLRTIKDLWNATTVRFGQATTRDTTAAKTTSGESAGTVAKQEFNEVRLVGFAKELNNSNTRSRLGKWISNPDNKLELKATNQSPPIIFSGGKSIEIKGENDVVLRGFSTNQYQDFSKKVLTTGKGTKPEFSVSAANAKSYADIEKAFDSTAKRTIASRLTSLSLFVQKLWDDAKSLVFGTASTPEIKSEVNTAQTSPVSSSGPESSFSSDKARKNTQSMSTGAAVSAPENLRALSPDSQPLGNSAAPRARADAGPPPMKRQETSEDVKAMMSQ